MPTEQVGNLYRKWSKMQNNATGVLDVQWQC